MQVEVNFQRVTDAAYIEELFAKWNLIPDPRTYYDSNGHAYGCLLMVLAKEETQGATPPPFGIPTWIYAHVSNLPLPYKWGLDDGYSGAEADRASEEHIPYIQNAITDPELYDLTPVDAQEWQTLYDLGVVDGLAIRMAMEEKRGANLHHLANQLRDGERARRNRSSNELG